jgi:hypothetical protein
MFLFLTLQFLLVSFGGIRPHIQQFCHIDNALYTFAWSGTAVLIAVKGLNTVIFGF